MQEQVKDAIIFEGIYLDSHGREKPIYKLPYRSDFNPSLDMKVQGEKAVAEIGKKVLDLQKTWRYLRKLQRYKNLTLKWKLGDVAKAEKERHDDATIFGGIYLDKWLFD